MIAITTNSSINVKAWGTRSLILASKRSPDKNRPGSSTVECLQRIEQNTSAERETLSAHRFQITLHHVFPVGDVKLRSHHGAFTFKLNIAPTVRRRLHGHVRRSVLQYGLGRGSN